MGEFGGGFGYAGLRMGRIDMLTLPVSYSQLVSILLSTPFPLTIALRAIAQWYLVSLGFVN